MAIYHLSMKTVARSKGQSATASAAYRAAEKITDQRTGETFDYSRKKGVIETALILPKDAPKLERSELWNAAEAAENRKNSTVAREYEVALPAELNAGERRQLVNNFVEWLVKEYGVAADVALHEPNRKGDEKNYHAHILTTTRAIGRDGFGEKTRQLDEKKSGEVEKIREKWETLCNHELSRKGEKEISRATLKAQGVDRLPQIHVGAAATAMERSGKTSLRFRRNQAIKDLPAYQVQLAELQKALAPAVGITPETPRTPLEAPSLKNTVELSITEAHALINVSLAQIEGKMLKDYHDQRSAERAKIDKRISLCWAEHAAAEKQKPEKSFFERPQTFDERIKVWAEECKKLRFKALDESKIRENHDTETWHGHNRVRTEARTLTEKQHPEAAAVIRSDEKRKEAERLQRQEEQKQQRELQRKNHRKGFER